MLDRFLTRWRGIALSLVIVVAVGVLAATDQLGTYIHPRYFVFTVVVCAVAGALCAGAWFVLPRIDPHEDDDLDEDHGHAQRPVGRGRAAGRVVTTLLVLGGLALVMTLPPQPLSAQIAATRANDTAAAVTQPLDLSQLGTVDYDHFSFKDWASLLAQGASASFLAGRTADLQGFVMPDPHGSPDVLLLTRLSVTCCAVDAQPVAVPVLVRDWAATWHQGDWMTVSGGFVADPRVSSTGAAVLDPSSLSAIAEPAQPYVY